MPVALVTGAAKRIGRTIALRLAEEGFSIAAHYNTSEADAHQLLDEIRSRGGDCSLFKHDFSSHTSVHDLLSDINSRYGVPDVVVNNASLFSNDDASDFDPDDFSQHINVNVKAPVMLTRELFRMSHQDYVQRLVINILDNKVFSLNPDFFSYTLSKVALKAATEMLAMRFAPRLRVCGIAPSITLISGKQSEANFEKAWKISPTGQGTTPEEIANAVQFILHTRNFNGQVITIDGGQTLMKLPRDVAYLVKEGLL